MSDEKQKKRSEMIDEILGTSPKKKEGLFEKLGCLGSVVFIIFVLVLLKLLFLF